MAHIILWLGALVFQINSFAEPDVSQSALDRLGAPLYIAVVIVPFLISGVLFILAGLLASVHKQSSVLSRV